VNHRKNAVAVAVMAAFLASSALAQPASIETHHAQAAPAPQAMPGGMMPGSGGMPMPGMAQGMPGGMMPGSGGMPMGMMEMMGQGGMGQMGAMMAHHVEGRIAFLKTEIKITEAQQPSWNAVADTMRANATTMMEMSGGMMATGAGTTLPDKLAAREQALTARLDTLRKYRAVVGSLYAALSDEQKTSADELMSGPMGMGMM
jgi:hypothetical protein